MRTHSVDKYQLNDKTIMHKLIETWECRPESYADFKNRYNSFGKDLFSVLVLHLPDLYSHLTFYQNINQPEDAVAVYDDSNHSFGIQLDPLIELIILWNEKDSIEVTGYDDQYYDRAIQFIKTKMLV
jgi:hypothetical protein